MFKKLHDQHGKVAKTKQSLPIELYRISTLIIFPEPLPPPKKIKTLKHLCRGGICSHITENNKPHTQQESCQKTHSERLPLPFKPGFKEAAPAALGGGQAMGNRVCSDKIRTNRAQNFHSSALELELLQHAVQRYNSYECSFSASNLSILVQCAKGYSLKAK